MAIVWSDVPLHPDVVSLFGGQIQIVGPAITPVASDPLHHLDLADAALVRTVFPGNEATFRHAARLKVIARTGIGYDNIDLDAATAHGICVTNAPDAPTISVAEFTFALMLAVTRRVTLADEAVRAQQPSSPSLIGYDLNGKTLGLVGLGRIGMRVAEIARAFRMTVIAFDPFAPVDRAERVGVSLMPDLASLLSAADVVSLHIPLTTETRGLIGKEALRQMKHGAVLVNTARGALVDENALADALESGHLSGVGLDVWASEPPSRDNRLLSLPQVVAAPHIAGSTHEGVFRSQQSALADVLRVLRGERPATLLNPEVWGRHRGFLQSSG